MCVCKYVNCCAKSVDCSVFLWVQSCHVNAAASPSSLPKIRSNLFPRRFPIFCLPIGIGRMLRLTCELHRVWKKSQQYFTM